MPWSRLLTAVLLAVLGCLLAVGVAWRRGGEATAAVATSPALPAADRVAPLAVLRAWDRARAEAWQRGDAAATPPALRRRARTPAAPTWHCSRRTPTEGCASTACAMQRAAVDVVAAQRATGWCSWSPTGWRRRPPSERAAGVALPRDDWSTAPWSCVRGDGDWRVAEVRDQASAGGQHRRHVAVVELVAAVEQRCGAER